MKYRSFHEDGANVWNIYWRGDENTCRYHFHARLMLYQELLFILEWKLFH